MRYHQNRHESNLFFWKDRRRRFKNPVVVKTSGNIRPERVDALLYGDFLSAVFERGGPRYFMFEGEENARRFVDYYSHLPLPPEVCEDPRP